MSWKAAISKPGHNVLTDTNADDLVFSSDYNTLKYYVSGNYVMTANVNTEVTIAHNLGYVPFFVAFTDAVATNPIGIANTYSLVEYADLFGGVFVALRAYADATNIYLSANIGFSTTYTIHWYYKIFLNNLGL